MRARGATTQRQRLLRKQQSPLMNRSLTGLYRRLRNRTESAVLRTITRPKRPRARHCFRITITAGGELHRTLRTCTARLKRALRGEYSAVLQPPDKPSRNGKGDE